MKKAILTLILASLINLGFSQKLKINEEKQISIDSTLYFDSTSSSDIYKALKKWAATNFDNVKDVTIYDTPEEIQFRYKEKVVSSNGGKWNVDRILIVKIKNGKLNIEFSKMLVSNIGGTIPIENVLLKNNGTFRIASSWRLMIIAIEDQFKLSTEIISKNIKAKKDNW